MQISAGNRREVYPNLLLFYPKRGCFLWGRGWWRCRWQLNSDKNRKERRILNRRAPLVFGCRLFLVQ